MSKKVFQTFRLSPFAFELMVKISGKTEETKTQVIERAIMELYRNHPEYWPPDEKKYPPNND